ncbi:MAG: pentapeptide repeat-containing protein, partial [Myxococcaceae bacterium]
MGKGTAHGEQRGPGDAGGRARFVRGALLAVVLGLQAGCKDQHAENVTQPERPFLYEAEFSRTAPLAALAHQVVIHELEESSSGRLAENVSRHALEAGSYTFCIERDDPWVRQLLLDDEEGRRRVALQAGSDCVTLELGRGNYRLTLLHDGKSIAGPHRVAFVRRLNASPPLLTDAGVPRSGWWALAPDDPTGQGRVGRLRAQPPPQSLDSFFYPSVEPVVADFSSRQVDEYALFNLEALGGNAPLGPLPQILYQQFPLDVTTDILSVPSSTLVANASGTTPNNKFGFDPLLVVDLGNQKAQLQARTNLFQGGIYSGFFIDTSDSSIVKWYQKPAGIPYMDTLVLFRAFPYGDQDGTQVVLQEGEVALYQQCNFGGQVTVFVLDTSDFSALTSSALTLDRTTASVKLGPATGVVLHADAGFTGTSQTVEVDTTCLDGSPIGRGTRSIQVRPLVQIFVASSSCEGCNLAGVDFSNLTVSGADLANASLVGATLNRTVFHASKSLAGTDFSGATITCSDFSGTPDRLVDLTATKMLTAVFTDELPTCRSNVADTKVSVLSLAPVALKQGNLTGSSIDFLGAGLTDLQGAMWPGATVLNGLFFDVDFSAANLSGVTFVRTAFDPNCSGRICRRSFGGATLDGVLGLRLASPGQPQDLTSADFSGASLGCLEDGGPQCVDLSGTMLAGVQFEGSRLAGTRLGTSLPDANFTGASLDGVTGLTGADLRGAVFAGATLPGTDLTGAMLDFADFRDAGVDGGILGSVTGLNTILTTGADFTGAQFGGPGLAGASLQGATLDQAVFASGSDMSGIRFNDSSLIAVDLSGRSLFGARFTRANLTNANLSGALLSNNPPAVPTPADFTGAHLKDVNLASAKLQGTVFDYASLYGSFNGLNNGPPDFPCETDLGKCGASAPTGFTCSCATVVGATMTRTKFTNAFLYGVDFGGKSTVINGVDFSNALLVGANFENTTFQTDPTQGGAQPVFSGAFLQGANLSTASLDTTSFENAYVDFEPNGNEVQVVLGSSYLGFKGWGGSNSSVCVQMAYDLFVTQAPVTTA